MIYKYHIYHICEHTWPPDRNNALLIGDQQITQLAGNGKTAKEYLKSIGYKQVVDVDYNGKADINFDLNEVLSHKLHNQFDLVFEGGVMEHLSNPGALMQSIVNVTKIGAIVILENPMYPYGQAYWGVDPQIHADFYRANGFEIVRQELFYDASWRMDVLHIICRLFPDWIIKKLVNRVRSVKGAKEFIFQDPTATMRIRRVGWQDREAYRFHWQTRVVTVLRKVSNPWKITWPAMKCYPKET